MADRVSRYLLINDGEDDLLLASPGEVDALRKRPGHTQLSGCLVLTREQEGKLVSRLYEESPLKLPTDAVKPLTVEERKADVTDPAHPDFPGSIPEGYVCPPDAPTDPEEFRWITIPLPLYLRLLRLREQQVGEPDAG